MTLGTTCPPPLAIWASLTTGRSKLPLVDAALGGVHPDDLILALPRMHAQGGSVLNVSRRLAPLIMILMLANAVPALAQDASPSGAPAGSAATVVPPDQDPLEVPYAEWAARWWS